MYEDDYMDAFEETYEPENEEAYYEENHEEYADKAYEEEFEEAQSTTPATMSLDARRRFAELHNNRGFYPVVALTDSAASSNPTASQRPYPPCAKGGKGKGKGQGPKSPPQKGDAKSRGRSALNQAKPGHLAAQCTQKRSTTNSPTNAAKKAKAETAMMVQIEMKDYQRI